MIEQGKKYELLMRAVKFNMWAKELKVSSLYSPNNFEGVKATNTKRRKSKSFFKILFS